MPPSAQFRRARRWRTWASTGERHRHRVPRPNRRGPRGWARWPASRSAPISRPRAEAGIRPRTGRSRAGRAATESRCRSAGGTGRTARGSRRCNRPERECDPTRRGRAPKSPPRTSPRPGESAREARTACRVVARRGKDSRPSRRALEWLLRRAQGRQKRNQCMRQGPPQQQRGESVSVHLLSPLIVWRVKISPGDALAQDGQAAQLRLTPRAGIPRCRRRTCGSPAARGSRSGPRRTPRQRRSLRRPRARAPATSRRESIPRSRRAC